MYKIDNIGNPSSKTKLRAWTGIVHETSGLPYKMGVPGMEKDPIRNRLSILEHSNIAYCLDTLEPTINVDNEAQC